MLVHKSRLSAYAVYLIFSGVTSLAFSTIFTVNLVYQVEVARLNPLQLVLLFYAYAARRSKRETEAVVTEDEEENMTSVP